MEQEAIYHLVEEKIIELKKLQNTTNEATLTKIQSIVNKEIEDHFDAIVKAVHDRKAALLKEADSEFQKIKANVENRQKYLKDKIDDTTKAIESARDFYQDQRDTAIRLLQGLSLTESGDQTVQVELPREILNAVSSHGKVVLSAAKIGEWRAEEVSTLVDGTGSGAQLHSPSGIAFNIFDGSLYVCDYGNDKIRKITTSGVISSFADIAAPVGITFYRKEKSFFVTSNKHTVHKITADGVVSLVAGKNDHAFHYDGKGEEGYFSNPRGITVDQQTGDLFVADGSNHTIRKVTPEGQVSTLAGTAKARGYMDGIGIYTSFWDPYGITFNESDGTLLVCDQRNRRLRKVTLQGKVSTVCQVPNPFCATILPNGVVLVSTSDNNIQKVILRGDEKATVEAFVGQGEEGTPQESQQFNTPTGLAFDISTNTCYVADQANHAIRKITLLSL